MAENTGKEKFYKAFIQVHLIAVIWTAITWYLTELFTAVFFYLFAVHILAGTVQIYGMEALKIENLSKYLKNPLKH